MYERFYRLRERPFALTPDPDYLYPSRVHKEALSYLRYGIETRDVIGVPVRITSPARSSSLRISAKIARNSP